MNTLGLLLSTTDARRAHMRLAGNLASLHLLCLNLGLARDLLGHGTGPQALDILVLVPYGS